MAGHLLVYSREDIVGEINDNKAIKLSTNQYNAGARQIKTDDVIFVGIGSGQDVNLWLISKAKTGVVKTDQGNGEVRLKSLRIKTSETCYHLAAGIVSGDTLRRGKWKLLDEQEISACFFDTNAYKAQWKKQIAVVPAGFGIDSESVYRSILLNTGPEYGSVSVKEAYNTDVTLNEQFFRAAIKRRLAQLDGVAFEKLVESLFKATAFGFSSVTRTKDTRDSGIDIVLTRTSEVTGRDITIVQCKCLQATDAVGIKEAQTFKIDMDRHQAGSGVFVTNTRFSSDAIKFVTAAGRIRLIDGPVLIDLLFRYAGQVPEIWNQASTPKQGILIAEN